MRTEKVTLNGSEKILTALPAECFAVLEGKVYVYVCIVSSDVMGRSFFLCECEQGTVIPTLDAGKKDGLNFHFLLVAAESAVLEARADVNTEADQKAMLERVKLEDPENRGFSYVLVDWYYQNLKREEDEIKNRRIEEQEVHESKLSLMASLFRDERELHYQTDSDSALYNAMSAYCRYKNIDICSIHALKTCFGDAFTVYDIAALSHFVIRKVSLDGEWYKKSEEAILTFKKEDQSPVICLKRRKHYRIYDLVNSSHARMKPENSEELEEFGYVAYEHLPGTKLHLSDVMLFGLRHIGRGDMVRFVVMYLVVTLLGLLLPHIHELFYDTLIPLGNVEAIWQVGVVLFAVMSANIFFSLVQNLAAFRGIKKMEYSIVSASYDRIFRLKQDFVEKFGTMELVNRTNAIPQVFSSTVSTGVTALMGLILSLFYVWHMFEKSKTLAWRGLIVTLISGVIMLYFGVRRFPSQRKKQRYTTHANSMLYQMISGVMKLKVSGIENRSLYEFQKENTEAMRQDIISSNISNLGNAVSTVMHVFFVGLIYYTVVKKRADLSIGEYSSFMIAYGFFTSAVQQVFSFFLTMANLFPVVERISPIFEEEAESTAASTVPGVLTGAMEVDHVSFAYEGQRDLVLKNVSMRIRPGEYIGIVGPSGSGKSTLLKCMLGFEKPTQGKIYYDDKDIDTLDKSALRRQIGTVLQDGQLVMGTILTNVTIAAPDLSIDEVEEVLKEAGIYDDIQAMPMGVYTSVSEGSGSVSGGQKQRILIARALANNPRIVFFDEATSALDNITQQKVCENLANRNVTRIMIAHRLSTVRKCDRIIVMDHGEIKETGNYDELMAERGLFYEFAQRQIANQMVKL